MPDKKKVTTVEYSCKEDEICLSRCSLGKLLRGKCGCKDDCDDCGKECGKIRTRRKLVKRFVTEEKCVTKCTPVVKEDDCAQPCQVEHGQPTPVMIPTTPSEKLPNPPKTSPK